MESAKLNKLHAMEVFVQVVDAGGFTRAAENIKLPKATVSTLVQSLETSLAVKLLHRTTRQVTVTAEGAAHYDCCIRILSDVREAEESLYRTYCSLSGRLRIDAPTGLASEGAARQLDLSAAAVTRAVQMLEHRLDAALLVRTTRRVTLSEADQRYLENARTILRMVEDAEADVSNANVVTRGCLRVTAPVVFGRLFVVPGIADYLERHPEMTVSAAFVDRTVNLIDEGFDIAVRIGQLPDSDMKALKVGEVGRVACASPAYLNRHGRPEHPSDLHEHRIIATDVVAQHVIWKFGT